MPAWLIWLAALGLLGVALRGAKYSVRQNPNGTWAVWASQNFRKRKATEIDFVSEAEVWGFIAQLQGAGGKGASGKKRGQIKVWKVDQDPVDMKWRVYGDGKLLGGPFDSMSEANEFAGELLESGA